MLVTVYITNYNYGDFIDQAIQSVLNQSFNEIEVLIIDDGSTDDSKDRIEKYADISSIRIIYQRNKGLNVTNNIALRTATGKYIMRLDADDYLEECAIEKMVDVLEKESSIGMVFPDYYLVNKDGDVLEHYRRHDFASEVTLYDLPAHGACTMVRREALMAVGGYDESYSCQDGYELWIKFIRKFKVANVNEPLFSYRQHGTNLTSNEERLLSTRKKIKSDFVERLNISCPRTCVVLPIRPSSIDGTLLAFNEVGGKKIIDLIIAKAQAVSDVSSIIVTSSSSEIETYLKEYYSSNAKVDFVQRPSDYGRNNETLVNTLTHIQDSIEKEFEAVMVLSIEYPLIKEKTIQEAIDTLVIFEADSVIGLRPDNATFYQHSGNGMNPILDHDKTLKLEREALYRGTGGIMLTRMDALRSFKKMAAGKVGHVVVDEIESLTMSSPMNRMVIQKMMTT